MISGTRRSSARSTARVIFSPTTTPIDPPMKWYSIEATIVSIPSMRPVATTTASVRPVACEPAARRALYGLVSVKPSGSVETSRSSMTSNGPSNSVRSRSVAVSRKWCAHFGQTLEVGLEFLVVDQLARTPGTSPRALPAPGSPSPERRSACAVFLNQAITRSLPQSAAPRLRRPRHVVARAAAHGRGSASPGRRAPRRRAPGRPARSPPPAAASPGGGRRSAGTPRSASLQVVGRRAVRVFRVAAALALALHQRLGRRLQVDDQVGRRDVLGQQVVEPLVDEQLVVVEIQVRVDPVPLEQVVGDDDLAEQVGLARASAAGGGG